jgi:hypothetical protein
MVDYSMRFRIPESATPEPNCFFWVRDTARDSFVATLLPSHEALVRDSAA